MEEENLSCEERAGWIEGLRWRLDTLGRVRIWRAACGIEAFESRMRHEAASRGIAMVLVVLCGGLKVNGWRICQKLPRISRSLFVMSTSPQLRFCLLLSIPLLTKS